MITTMTPAAEATRYTVTELYQEIASLIRDFGACRVSIDGDQIAVYTDEPLQDDLIEQWDMRRSGFAAITNRGAILSAIVYGPREVERSV